MAPSGQAAGSTPLGQSGLGQGGSSTSAGSAYAQAGAYGQQYASTPSALPTRRKTPVGWWLGAAALLLVVVLVAAFVIRGLTGGDVSAGPGNGQPSQDACPLSTPSLPLESPVPKANDGRVHGGPVSYPLLGDPWGVPKGDVRVPFGRDVSSQEVMVERNYTPNNHWVASVLVGELRAGDGFFTPEQGSQVVVKCILGAFYGDNEVKSDVTRNQATTIDGREGWLVESQLSFDIDGLETKGELLIVAIVTTGSTAGLFYASIPDTAPQLVQPAREALANLQVDG